MCKLSPAEFNQYSIAELNAIIAARVKEMDRTNGFIDALNARQCEIVALCAGNKDAKLADFLILKRESETNINPESPEDIGEKLKMLTMSMGGKVVYRG